VIRRRPEEFKVRLLYDLCCGVVFCSQAQCTNSASSPL
jgi:hypothetical protein